MTDRDGFVLRSVAAGPADDPILTDVSVVLPAAGVTVIVGPSGSGKSTLLRLLNRLDEPLAGHIEWNGARLDDLAPERLRRQVATVFQRAPIFPGTVFDNFKVADVGVELQRAEHVLGHVGLAAELLHRDAAALSGGEAQRMCVARALLTRPAVLLADEPTAALDGDASRSIEELALQLAAEGIAVVWVSHDTAQVRRIADHVVVIIDGRVAAFGHLDDVDQHADDRVRRLIGATS